MSDFVSENSIVRRIWGNADMVLLVFAGSAAEFALNRAVDWLFYTGRLPDDPIARLFSTAAYSQQIVFADERTATATLERIQRIHEAVERQRGDTIPQWAHRDVLYMLIDYSERAYELLAGPLTSDEQDELYAVFRRVGAGLGVRDLPATYGDWRRDRELHLRRDLVKGDLTSELYARYRRHLGPVRYALLLHVQSILVPSHARKLLGFRRSGWLQPLVRLYPVLVHFRLRHALQRALIPPGLLSKVRELEHRPVGVRANHAGSIPSRCPFGRLSAAMRRPRFMVSD